MEPYLCLKVKEFGFMTESHLLLKFVTITTLAVALLPSAVSAQTTHFPGELGETQEQVEMTEAEQEALRNQLKREGERDLADLWLIGSAFLSLFIIVLALILLVIAFFLFQGIVAGCGWLAAGLLYGLPCILYSYIKGKIVEPEERVTKVIVAFGGFALAVLICWTPGKWILGFQEQAKADAEKSMLIVMATQTTDDVFTNNRAAADEHKRLLSGHEMSKVFAFNQERAFWHCGPYLWKIVRGESIEADGPILVSQWRMQRASWSAMSWGYIALGILYWALLFCTTKIGLWLFVPITIIGALCQMTLRD